jgi:hypothetical protein
MAHRNFARGESPPSHSWEWVGVAKPPEKPTPVPGKTAPSPGKKIPVIVATMQETVVIERKKKFKLLPWLLVGGGGFLAGWVSRSQKP